MKSFISMCRLRVFKASAFAGLLLASSVFAPRAEAVPPPAPVPISPNGPTTIANPPYTWNASTGATSYFVQVGDGVSILRQGTYTTAEVCSTTPCAIDLAYNLSAGVNYWWAVRAKKGVEGTWSVTLNFTGQPPPAPVQGAPSGTISNPRPLYTWNASAGATEYYLYVSNGSVPVFQGYYPPASVCSGSACSFTQPTDLAAGPYGWAVQARNVIGGTWSNGLSFTVQAPPAPNTISPSGAIGIPTPPFTWNTSSGATQYYLLVKNSAGAAVSQGLYDASQYCIGSNCSFTFTGVVLSLGSYSWTAQARNAAGGGPWSPDKAFSVQAPPAPAASSPTGSVATSTPTYTWSPSTGGAGATSYLLRVNNGTTNVDQTYGTNVCTATTCSVTPATALVPGSYTWSVRATNAVGSTWSNSLGFGYGSAPAAPTLVSPNGPMAAVTPTYVWNVSIGATQYWIEVRDENNAPKYQSLLAASTYCSVGQCSVAPGVTLAAGDYYWSVTAQNTAGSASSPNMPFTVVGCSGEVKTGDFNGDGRTDRLCAGPTSVAVSLANGTGFTSGSTWLPQSVANLLIADFNSDGLADIGKFDSTTAGFSVARSTGTSFDPLQPWGTANIPQVPQACAGTTAKADVGDFNGDGRPDVSCKLSGLTSVFVGLSNGSSFTFSTFGTTMFCETGERTGTMDVNGDGKSDWYCQGPANNVLLVFPSNGTTFASTGIPAADSAFCDDADVFFGDFNADGKTDVSCRGNGRVRLSTGSSFLDIGGNGGNWCIAPTQSVWPFAFAADVDGDGTPEMVCHGGGVGGGGLGLKVRKWLGTSLGPEQPWGSGFCGANISVGDFNGDGKVDILCNKDGKWATAGTVGARADLLSQSTNGLRGSTSVTYLPSTAFTNQPGIGPRPLARTVTTSDGRSGPSTTTYTYGGGKMDFLERMFLGFQTFRADLPCLPESGCPYVVTTAYQTLASAGKPFEVQRLVGTALLSRQTYQYTETDPPTLPRKSLLNRTDSYAYGSAGGTLQTSTTYPSYDAYGNVLQTISHGDYSQTGDELQTDTTFVPNTTAYIVGLPAKVERRVPGGPALQTETYEYDLSGSSTVAPTKGDLTAIGRWLDVGNRTVKRRMTYNTLGQLLTSVDETNGPPATTTYETTTGHSLFPATVTNPAGETTSYVWDPSCAAIISTTDPNGQVTGQTYDPLCRANRTTLPLGGYVQLSYPDLGLATQRTRTQTPPGASGDDWSEDYFDGLGRTYKSLKRGPSAIQTIVSEKTFNARGGVATSTEPYYADASPASFRVTSYEYDAADRLVRTDLPDDNDVQVEYLANGQTTTDPNGKTVTTRVDGLVQEVERLWNSSPSITTTTYDILGRQITLEDAKDHTWTYEYDSLNRQREENDPDAGQWQYDYDDAGRPTTQTDAKGQVTTMTYNTGGRLATKLSPTGTVTYTYSQAEPGYFNIGRLTTIASPVDTLKLDYDPLGRTKRQRRTINGTTYEVIKAWNAGGYLLGTKYPDNDIVGTITPPSGTSLGYDEAGRLKSIPNLVSNITYDAAGRPAQKTNASGNNAVTTWTYSPLRGFLTGLMTTSSAGTLQNLTYGYDPAGLVQNSTQVLADTTGSTFTQTWTYGYDSFDHLTSATDANAPANNQTWNYDEIGRIVYNSRVGTYQYPDPGLPRPHAPKGLNNAPPDRTYDANGHLLTAPSQALTWDGDTRLYQTVVSGTTTNFAHDSVGERIAKVSGSNVSIYPFGDDYEVRNGTITKYISVEGLGVIAKKVGATPFWLHTDRLGSIQVVTNSSGSPQLGRTYRPYGETLTTNGSHTEFRGWIDQRNDSESGFTYLHARYFDPKLGQFLSPDRLDPGLPGVGLNQYAYGFDDPVNGTDRSGLSTCQGWTWTSFFAGMPTGSGGDSSGTCGSGIPFPRTDMFGPGSSPTPQFLAWLREQLERENRQNLPGPGTGPVPIVITPPSPRPGPKGPGPANPFMKGPGLCGVIPVAPPRANLHQNMREAASQVNPFWFRAQVKNGGPWDYKQDGPQFEAFGNFNFGATGASMWIPARTLLREAGRAQIDAGTSRPGWGYPGALLNPWGGQSPYGDDPADQSWIQQGIDYAGCQVP